MAASLVSVRVRGSSRPSTPERIQMRPAKLGISFFLDVQKTLFLSIYSQTTAGVLSFYLLLARQAERLFMIALVAS